MRISDWSSDVCSSDLKVADAISAMRQRSGKGTQYDRRQHAAQDVFGLIDPDVVGPAFTNGEIFTDGEISFKENGKVQTINAETVDRLFVYPLRGKRPKEKKLLAEALVIVTGIANTLGVQIS